jgi:hypothetical protein
MKSEVSRRSAVVAENFVVKETGESGAGQTKVTDEAATNYTEPKITKIIVTV